MGPRSTNVSLPASSCETKDSVVEDLWADVGLVAACAVEPTAAYTTTADMTAAVAGTMILRA